MTCRGRQNVTSKKQPSATSDARSLSSASMERNISTVRTGSSARTSFMPDVAENARCILHRDAGDGSQGRECIRITLLKAGLGDMTDLIILEGDVGHVTEKRILRSK